MAKGKQVKDEKKKKTTPAKKTSTPKPKRKVETIEKSKVLASKCRKPRKSNAAAALSTSTTGKPMPSLAQLEQMFEDSDSDCEQVPTSSLSTPKREDPPKPVPTIVDQFASPTKLLEISNKVIDLVSNLSDISIILPNEPKPPVIPPRKRKKPEQPYIVGCTERQKVSGVFQSVVGAGDTKYGIEYEEEEDEENLCPNKRVRSQVSNPTKSKFNAQSEEIAAMLKAAEQAETLSNGSGDSNKTIEYSTISSPGCKPRPFSPLPSTSTDHETILKNDQRLNESLLELEASMCNVTDDVEIIDVPCETIIIDDSLVSKSFVKNDPDVVEVQQQSIIVADDGEDDMYSSIIDLDETCGDNPESPDIIDVDELIAQNQAIIGKFKSDTNTPSVTLVESANPTKIMPKPISQDNHNSSDVTVIGDIVTNFFQTPRTSVEVGNSAVPQNTWNIIQPIVQSIATIFGYQNVTQPQPVGSANVGLSTIDLSDQSLNSSVIITGIEYNNNNNRRQKKTRQPRQNKRVSAATPNVRKTTSIPQIPLTPSIPATPAIPATVSAPSPPENSPARRLGDCPICMDSLSSQAIASTVCGHVFCMKCIQGAIKASGKKCPTCRKKLTGAGYHQLFL